MSEVTVKKLAEDVGAPVERLLKQIQDAGLKQTADTDMVSDTEKQTLLAFLKRSHGEAGAEGEAKKITLKRKTTSTLKVAAGQGKTKTVNVEVRKKRTYVKRDAASDTEVEDQKLLAEKEALAQKAAEEEKNVEQARIEAEAQKAEEAKKSEEAQKVKLEEDKRKAEPEKEKSAPAKPAPQKAAAPAKPAHKKKSPGEYGDKDKHRQQKAKATGKSSRKNSTISLSGDDSERHRKQRHKKRSKIDLGHQFEKPVAPMTHEVQIPESITVSDLASRMSVKGTQVVKVLFGLGVMATINETIDQETATLVVEEMGHTVQLIQDNAVEANVIDAINYEGEEVTRAPVVTVMGHVDHGKTSLLDYIRRAKVADGESGGITQHIGAYHVETGHGMISFLDTPGHAAFTAMRARGASSTDIVILVVAADDGVMPQTEEAVQHARSAGVPIIVAINKIDKEGADADRVKNELAAKDVIPEDWGGDVQFISVSAHSGEGIDDLLDAVLLQSELLELKAVPLAPAKGVVVESSLDKGRGAVSTVLVQNGTLRQGDIVIAGMHFGRVKAMLDENGLKIDEAGPSIPVEILGLGGTPDAGDDFIVVPSEKRAREVTNFRLGKYRDTKFERQNSAKLENMFQGMGKDEVKNLNIVLKTDVRGSLEALTAALAEIGNEEVQVKIVSSGVGGIAETDASLALATNAVIIGFNVRADASAKRLIEAESIDLRYYSIIYDIIDHIKQALTGMLAPEFREDIVGLADVRDTFRSPKFGQVAGCMVTEGTIYRNKQIRVLRDNVVIFEGELESLRRFKDDVNDVRSGTECGIGVKNYDVKVGDKIEVFDKVRVERTL